MKKIAIRDPERPQQRLSYLVLMRLADDEIEIKHITADNSISRVAATFRGVREDLESAPRKQTLSGEDMSIFTDREFSISDGDPICLYDFKIGERYTWSGRHWYHTNADKDISRFGSSIAVCKTSHSSFPRRRESSKAFQFLWRLLMKMTPLRGLHIELVLKSPSAGSGGRMPPLRAFAIKSVFQSPCAALARQLLLSA